MKKLCRMTCGEGNSNGSKRESSEKRVKKSRRYCGIDFHFHYLKCEYIEIDLEVKGGGITK